MAETDKYTAQLDYIKVTTEQGDVSIDISPAEMLAGDLDAGVDGNIAVVVGPGFIAARSPEITIEAHETIIDPQPAEVEAFGPRIAVESYEAKISPSPADVEAGAIAPAAAIYEAMIDISPAEMVAVEQEIEISAHTTIIFPHPARVKVVDGDAPLHLVPAPDESDGSVVFPAPASVLCGSMSINIVLKIKASSRTITLFHLYIVDSDGNEEIKIPISSFQLVLYADRNAYLEVNVPGLERVDEITDRTDGNLLLKMGHAAISTLEVLEEEQVIKVPIENMDVHRGANKRAITLSGHETESQAESRQSTSKTVTLSDKWYNYKRMSDGKITARLVKPHMYLQAGDTIVDDDAEFVADRITWTKSERRHHMEIAGTAA